MMDVPDAQMRRLGRWDHSRMTQHYSTGLPRQGARMLAEHGREPGMFIFYVVTYGSRKLLPRSRMLVPS